ncbi:MAG TPA: VanW family protein [bacterium]|nr:VanW family protein [bacterium]
MNLPKKPIDLNSKIQKAKPYIFVLYGLLIIAVVFNLIYAKKIIPGVKIAGINVGGMTFESAKKVLEENEKNIPEELKLKFEDKEFPLKRNDIGLTYDWEDSVVRCFDVGRSGNFFIDTKDKIFALFKGLSIPASYDYDDDSFGIKLSVIRREINLEPQNSKFYLEDGKLSISPSSDGRKLLEEDFHKDINLSFGGLDFSDKIIPVQIVKPEITEKDIELFREIIEEIISEDLVINFEEKKWTLDSEKILNLIGFEKNEKEKRVKMILDKSAFRDLANELAAEVNESPKGEVVSTDGNKVLEFRIIKEGKELDEEKFKEDLKSAIFDDRKNVSLVLKNVDDFSDKEKYGILSLIGEGTSHFAGSTAERIHNIILAAGNISGSLVPPGAVYSMNKSVGPIDYQHGFKSAFIIKGGRTVLGEGGGVCQTSTTLFRAILNSGLPVVSRYPHAYRVGYYEQDMPVGFDAAIFQPSWDFKFKNDTNAYVLIQAHSNLSENSLTFKIYGTPDGRSVEISEPVVTDQSPPPPPLYEDDPSLPKGVVRQVDYAAWGATATFTRTVRKEDTILFTDTFTSRYQPWRAVYKVGTKE